MTTIAADYQPIHIGHVRLSVGADVDRTFEFRLPPETSDDDSPMIVAFHLISSNDLHMQIALNGTVFSDRQYTNGAERWIYDLANHVSFSTSDRNTLVFTVLRGEVSFSDVVLWSKREAFDSTISGPIEGNIQDIREAANYTPIHSGRAGLPIGVDRDRTFEFRLPPNTSPDSPLIVAFHLISSNDLHMQIAFNGTLISDRQYTNGPERCIQDFANHVSFSTSDRNTLVFTVLRGEVLFSDVVLWFSCFPREG
jgi:hypothetical protein